MDLAPAFQSCYFLSSFPAGPLLTRLHSFSNLQVPVYIYAPEEEGQFQPGRCSRWWLDSSLKSLEADLIAAGSRLLKFRAAESGPALAKLVHDLGAQGVFFNHLYDPISMVRDNEVKTALTAMGIACRSFTGDVLLEPWEVLDPNNAPFSSFDSFWAAHCALPTPAAPLPAPASLPPLSSALDSFGHDDLGIMTPEEELSNDQLEYHWQPGTAAGRRLLKEFIEGDRLRQFAADRAKTDRNSTSKLSPHIHFGEISARGIYAAATAKGKEWSDNNNNSSGSGAHAVQDFLRQLGYREYSRYLSFHFPFTHERSLLEHLRAVPWRFDQSLFKAWRTGNSGYPLIDAGMREVWSTGWMHNCIRVVAASFLCKILLLPWQWGLKHYWDALLDADLECDALGWQYCAGCLSDAHPFEHVMDLESEAKRFDPKGNYVRRWIPVLARLPAKYIHAPWEAPADILADAGVELGVNYPWPVVDMEESKEALAAVVKIVEELKVTSYNAESGGPGGGGTCDADKVLATETVPGVDVPAPATVAAPHLANNPSGPFRPATIPDPLAAHRVWGIQSAVVQSDACYGGGGGGGGGATGGRQGTAGNGVPISAARVAARSLRSGDESYNEEVESNAIGILGNSGGGGALAITADYDINADASMLVAHNQEQQQQQEEQQKQEQEENAGEALDAVHGGDSSALAPVLARPPLPVPQSHTQRQVVTAPVAVVLVDGTTPGSNGDSNGRLHGGPSNGGSNRASLTVAVPTISENPIDVQVPDTSAPVTTQGDGYHQQEAERAENRGEEDGLPPLILEEEGKRRRYLERSRSVSPAVALCGRAEGTTGGDHHNGRTDSKNTAGGSGEDPVWPPEAKRQCQGSS